MIRFFLFAAVALALAVGSPAVAQQWTGPAIGQPVYGGFVQLKSEDGEPAEGLEPVELPELNNGPHFFYGLQWWFFGILAIVGFAYIAYDEWRTGQRGEEVVSERKTKRAAKNAHKQKVRAAYQAAYQAERDQRARSMPPSTGSIEPETNDDAGDSRNAATRPNSSGSP